MKTLKKCKKRKEKKKKKKKKETQQSVEDSKTKQKSQKLRKKIKKKRKERERRDRESERRFVNAHVVTSLLNPTQWAAHAHAETKRVVLSHTQTRKSHTNAATRDTETHLAPPPVAWSTQPNPISLLHCSRLYSSQVFNLSFLSKPNIMFVNLKI